MFLWTGYPVTLVVSHSLSQYSAGLPNRPSRPRLIQAQRIKIIDLLSKENYNQAFLNCFQKTEKNDLTQKK